MPNKRTVGLLAGKFNIVHLGHIDAILQAYSQVDSLHVFVGADPVYEASRHDPFGEGVKDAFYRARAISQTCRDLPNLHVHILADDPAPGTFQTWARGAHLMRNLAEVSKFGRKIIFSSEPSYYAIFQKLYPDFDKIVTLGKRRDISATKIFNQGVKKSWDQLPLATKLLYQKKIVVMGPESTGKTTLLHKLAVAFNGSLTSEAARIAWLNYGGEIDNVFDVDDYLSFTYQQQVAKRQAFSKGSYYNFLDTDSATTYCWLTKQNQWVYFDSKRKQTADQTKAAQVLDGMSYFDSQQADLTFLIDPSSVAFVQDGTRVTEGDERLKAFGYLKDRLTSLHRHFVLLDGNYEQNYLKACQYLGSL